VVLVDQHVFPRDKVCGDGLIPDAHAALRRLGVLDEVMAQAAAVPHVRCIGRAAGGSTCPARLAVLPRLQLDTSCNARGRAGRRRFLHACALRGPAARRRPVIGARWWARG
jgi:hypothetical protein